MLTHAELLSTPDQIRALAERLRQKRVIGFDTEFIRENTFYPIVEILQVATDEESWLCYSLLRDYYVARPEAKRTKSGADALEPSARISAYRSGRSPDWLKVKKSGLLGGEAEAEEDWGH